MTTTTDDINPRLAALEADVRNINVQLENMRTDNRETRAETQAQLLAVNARLDQTNARIDQLSSQLNAKIDRMLFVFLGGVVTLLVGMVLVAYSFGGGG